MIYHLKRGETSNMFWTRHNREKREMIERFVRTTSAAELMTMAINDMEAIIDNPTYVFESHTWHEPSGDQCIVCSAGAVMVNRLNVNASKYLEIDDFPHDVRVRLFAIDTLRRGLPWTTYCNLGTRRQCEDEMRVPNRYFQNDDEARIFISFWKHEGIPHLRRIENQS